MKVWRIFKDKLPPKNFTVNDLDFLHRLNNILRLKPGEKIILFDGSGFDFTFQIEKAEKRIISLKFVKKEKGLVPKKKIDIYISVIKKERFEWAIEKLSEIGANSITPVYFEKTKPLKLNLNRLEKIALEACEIAGWSKNLILKKEVKFDGLEKLEPDRTIVLEKSLNQKKFPKPSANRLNIVIGPEGGFSEKETEKMKSLKFKFISLGLNTLRTETAAVAGLIRLNHD